MKKLRVIVIGAGDRGSSYTKYMFERPEQYEIVGMADPVEPRRRYYQETYGVPAAACYKGWEEILAQPKMADIALISTVDSLHYRPALAAIEKGYNLLLEKPVAQTAQECADIAAAAKRKGVKVLVCHVLRYTPFYGKIKELLMQGVIGQVVCADLVEAVGHIHYGHSYVRGNWHDEKTSTPMLLAKCCHDLDIIQWLLDKPCTRIQSFGSLTHFTAENAPQGAPVRCADGGCPVGETCPYNCLPQYYEGATPRRRKIVTAGLSSNYEPTDEEVLAALKVRDYGLCVYHANNNVVDHQTVNMEFAGGVTATLNMNAFNQGGRYIRLYGTKGELCAYARGDEIEIFEFEGKRKYTVPVTETEESINGGHGGGDQGIVKELYEYMVGDYTGFRAADIHVSVQNHLMGFAAEESRRNGTVVSVPDVLKQYGME